MNYDCYSLTCWYITIYIFTLLHVLIYGSFDVYGKDSIIDWKKQIVNIPSQNINTNPIKEGTNKKVSNRKEKPPHL